MKQYYVKNIYSKSKEENYIEILNILLAFIGTGDQLLFKTNGMTQFETFSVYERKVFENSEWVYPYDPPMGYYSNEIWYAPRSNEEIKEIIQEDWYFTCVVHKIGRQFSERLFVLQLIEESDFCAIAIYCKKQSLFKEVLPRLQIFIRNGLEII